ncbi:MAG TPA: hypothetical protein VGV09_17660 [Steroidobacteraceae bacterium]|nr:hypothetical protein [Steroidobacteraceae bacterium]
MRIKAAIGLGVLTLAFAVAFAAPPADQPFLGKWTATAAAPGGTTTETLTVVKADKGFAITGKPAMPPPEGVVVSPGIDVKLDGNSFSYKRTITTPGGVIVISYSGVISGDTFTGMAELGGTKIPYNGVRIK